MKNIKTIFILMVLSVILLYSAIGFVSAKYTNAENISDVQLTVIPRPQYEISGIDVKEVVEKNTKSDVTVACTPQYGWDDRLFIKIKGLTQTGLYQLSFDTIFKCSHSESSYIIDSKTYVYGCTIGSNDKLTLGDGYYLWKSIAPSTGEHVDLAFYVTSTDVANGYVTWTWNLSNIVDNYVSRLYLTNIEIQKIASPANPYIDFPSAQFVYCQQFTNAELWFSYADQTIGTYKYHPGKGTYATKATYNDFVFSLECLGGHESINIPLKNLTVGSTYKLKFGFMRSEAAVYSVTNHLIGCCVRDSKYKLNNTLIDSMPVHYYYQDLFVESKEFTFTATASTMYWLWQFSGLADGQWVPKLSIFNCSISKV